MKRITALSTLLLVSMSASAHARATFDSNVNGLTLPKDSAALRTYDFEAPASLVGLEFASWDASNQLLTFQRTPIAAASDVANLLTAGGDDAVEGGHALRLGAGGKGLLIADPALFAQVKDTRFEVTFWARVDGASVQLYVLYGKDATNVGLEGLAYVRGVRTGRETSDGWAEFVAGPLDGTAWDVPPVGIAVVPTPHADTNDSFLLDALEVRTVGGSPVAPTACTQENVDQICGAEGDCIYGHCISSAFTWGQLPSLKQRTDITERWIQWGTRLMGDRNASARGLTTLLPQARALAVSAQSSRQFFGGMNYLVNELRNNHTSFGSPSNHTNFTPQVSYGSSSSLGACFGVVEKDIADGGLGFAVFRATEHPLTGTPLTRGDLLVAIDGRDPKAWLDEVWPRFATTMPDDPESDWATAATQLSRLIAMRASTVTLARCASASTCTPDSRTTFDIDIANAVHDAVVGAVPAGTSPSFSCSSRFTDSVAITGGGGGSEDPVYTATGPIGETRVQFDGFEGADTWKAAFTNIFSSKPATVLMDARMGHGGYLTAVQHLFDLVRGTSEPNGVMLFGRGTYDTADPSWLFTRLDNCIGSAPSDQWACLQGYAGGFFTSAATPPGADSRIAWLNSNDVSANDFMPRLLKGRSNFRIFAPHPTSGAFGAIVNTPALFTSWGGGSLQVQDSRFGANVTVAESVRWESGHGVAPDQVVVQRLSDAISGVDTIIQAATAWLASGP
jgi:hypothetical protein